MSGSQISLYATVPPGALLVDTGLTNSYVETTEKLDEPASGTPVALNLLGTDGAVSYSYTLDGDSSQAPGWKATRPARPREPWSMRLERR